MNKLLFSYLAGIMDSDGYFSIKKSLSTGKATYCGIVGMKQVCDKVPFLLKDTFGGSVCNEKPAAANRKACFRFSASCREAATLCKSLLPYLKVKRDQAQNIINMNETKSLGKRLTQDIIDLREKLYTENKEKNKNGITGILEVDNNEILISYISGAIDADGCITIKKSNYKKRKIGDCVNNNYYGRVLLSQTSPTIPYILKKVFGGNISITKSKHGKDLYRYEARNAQSYNICKSIIKYLRIKNEQASLVIDLQETKNNKYRQYSYWFEKENPEWKNMDMITIDETMGILKYKGVSQVSQAIHNGTILALPYNHENNKPRICKPLIMRIANEIKSSRTGKALALPQELIKWKESLWTKMSILNKLGINGTEANHRTGVHKPK